MGYWVFGRDAATKSPMGPLHVDTTSADAARMQAVLQGMDVELVSPEYQRHEPPTTNPAVESPSNRPRPKLKFTLPVLACVICAAALVCLRPSITRANFDRIQLGMTRDEVECILGGPARSSVCERMLIIEYVGSGPLWFTPSAVPTNTWTTRRLDIWVDFDDDGRVRNKNCVAILPVGDETLSERLLAWLGF